jgi:hypothetical protein
MKTFNICTEAEIWVNMSIEAETEEEAKQIAEEEIKDKLSTIEAETDKGETIVCGLIKYNNDILAEEIED